MNRIKKGNSVSHIYILLIIVISHTVCTKSNNDLILVDEGKASSVLVVPIQISDLQQIAINDFRNTILKSSGAEIPVISAEQATSLPEKVVRIVLGPGPMAEQLGCKADDLKDEEFYIRTIGNNLIILACDISRGYPDPRGNQDSRVTNWAFCYLLDHFVGVRWLWPGELGTVIPQNKTIAVPELNIRVQQKLVDRRFRRRNPIDTTYWIAWTSHHQVAGKRVDYETRHSFREGGSNGSWYEKFHLTHPEYLAKDPSGRIGTNPNSTKLCISNPDVPGEIVRLWEKAGMPDFWDVTPNDGIGFCTCENCRDLDQQYGGIRYSKEQVWHPSRYPPLNDPDEVVDGIYVSLTDRYVWFWNQLITAMREKKPDVKIGVYFYSAYRNPPRNLKLEEGIVGKIVHGYNFSFWESWWEAGAREIGLRPNWWHVGACGPHLPFHLVGHYIEQARNAGMILIDMDSMHEYWATQGPYYYLVARLIARPDLSTEDIIDEYCEAFGPAAADMHQYLDFWEEYHTKVAYNIPAGGMLSQDPDGLYEKICRENFGVVKHPLSGHWRTLPFIYTPDILDQADAILDQAKERATKDETRQRIEFLKDGLVQVKITSALIKAPENKKDEALKALVDFTREMRIKYGYWCDNGISVMKNRGVIGKEVDLSGM